MGDIFMIEKQIVVRTLCYLGL